MTNPLLSISGRERLLLGSLLSVCLLLWGSFILRRWTQTSETLSEAKNKAEAQEIWLENEPIIRARLEKAVQNLDSERMLETRELIALVDGYARKHRLRHELSTPTVTSGKLLSRATLRVTLRDTTLEELIRLQLFLADQRPYVALDGIALTANRADPRLLDARLQLTAITIHPEVQTP